MTEKINPDAFKHGQILCDMHDSDWLEQLKEAIPGFQLVYRSEVETEYAESFVDVLIQEATGEDFSSANKYLYLQGESLAGYKAVYHYDRRRFGIVTFKIEKPK